MKKDDCLVKLNNVSKSFGKCQILNGVSLEIKPAEFISIMGPSGCGKSTLMNILGLLDDFDGEYYMKGNVVKRGQYAEMRNKYIGFVFQLYYLIPNITVEDNILLPLMYAEKESICIAEKKFNEIVQSMGIEHLLKSKVDNLSGGEKQRVAIARAMILQPSLLLADEPTGALDEDNAEDIVNYFEEYVRQGKSVVMVTHDKGIAKRANKQYRIEKGALYEVW